MGRRRARLIADEVSEELQALGIVLDHGVEATRALVVEMHRHLEMRELRESSSSQRLPTTDRGDRPITIAELVGLAHDNAFALRRASDGLVASRPIALDATKLSRRAAAALRILAGPDGKRDLPKRLHPPAVFIAMGVFELSRSLVGYLAAHHAPDVAAGRDAPDAWLDESGTSQERVAAIRDVALAHRVMERLRPRSAEDVALLNRALMFAQRIAAIVQAASADVPHTAIAGHVRSQQWLEPSEVEAARACINAATQRAPDANTAELSIALAMIDVLEGQATDLATALREAAEHLDGINQVGVLRTVIGLEDRPEARADAADALIAATMPGTGADALILRVQSLPQLLDATASTALADPRRAALLARRIAALPDLHDFTQHHVWLIPGRTPVALIEWQPTQLEVVPLPALNDLSVMETLIVRHAEEFAQAFDLGRLRQQLTAMIDPLRTALSTARAPVTFHAFGWLKHIPLAGLTGRGSILAIAPGLHLFAPGPSERAASGGRPADRRQSRLYLIDDELSGRRPLTVPVGSEVARFDSRLDGNEAKQVVQSALARRDTSELIFFGHGHVDQFHLLHAGLVVGETGDAPLFVPSIVLARLDLRSIDMALVMACGAGQGNVFVEPSLSVGHAFRAAGARTVIAPQWPILAADGLAFTQRFLTLVDQGTEYGDAWARVLAQDPRRFMSVALLSS